MADDEKIVVLSEDEDSVWKERKVAVVDEFGVAIRYQFQRKDELEGLTDEELEEAPWMTWQDMGAALNWAELRKFLLWSDSCEDLYSEDR